MLAEKVFLSFLHMSHKNSICVLDKGGETIKESISPKQLNTLALKLAFRFNTLYRHQKRFLISMELGIEFVVTILACIYAHKTFIVVPIPRIKNELQRVLSIKTDSDTSVVLVTARSKYFFDQEHIYHAFQELIDINLNVIDSNFEDLKNIEEAFYELQHNIMACGESDLVVIQYTSGSTGNPKGVMISKQNILNNHSDVAKRWGFDNSQSFLSWLPVFHDMGLFGIIYRLFLSGMQLYILPTNDFLKKPISWLKAMSYYRIDNSGAPPFAFNMCSHVLENEKSLELDLSNWKIAFCGADYVAQKALEAFRQIGARYKLDKNAVFATYGMAESTLFVTGEPLYSAQDSQDWISQKSLSEGCYLNEQASENLLIYNIDSKSVVPEGIEGEILIKGESISAGYLSVNMEFIKIGNDKWLRTGDLGFIEKKFLFVTGRSKDLIKVYGRGLSINDMVSTLSQHFEELNAHAGHIFTKDPFSSSVVIIFELHLKRDKNETSYMSNLKNSIKRALFDEYGIHATEVLLLSRGSMPKTTSGKIQRNLVELLYRKGMFN